MKKTGLWLALIGACHLSACGGGGGGTPAPSPPPPSPPPPADTTAPDTTLGSTPAALSNQNSATFTATSSETGGTFEASLDNAAFTVVTATFTLSNLADGAHTVQVRARDAATNVDASPATFTWTVDTTAPDTALNTLTPLVSATNSASFTFTSEAGATFEVSVNSSPFSTALAPLLVTGLADGGHQFRVRARDAAGNVDATPASYHWIVDTVVPDTSFTSTPPALTNTAVGTFGFASSEALVFYEVRVDGGAWNLAINAFATAALADGAHTLDVRSSDQAGNVDTTPARHSWTVDTTAPDTSIVSAPPSTTNTTSANFQFQSEAGATFEASVDGAAFGATPATLALTNVSSGSHTVRVRATDAAGNVDATPATFTWQVDTLPPSASIVFPTELSLTDSSVLAVRGTAADSQGIAAVSVNGVAASSTDGFLSWTASVPIALGNNTLTVSVSDTAGNTSANADSVVVANRGAVLSDTRGVTWDPVNQRVLVADSRLNGLFAMNPATGITTAFSDATHGTGIDISGFSQIAVDAANNRAIMAYPTDGFVSIDLTTGNRTHIPVAPATPDSQRLTGLVCGSPCTRIYSILYADPLTSEMGVFSTDLAAGAHDVVTGGQFHMGSGQSLVGPVDLVYDTTRGTPRILVSDNFHRAIFAVNLTTGERTHLSTNSFNSGPAFERPGGLALDAANNRLLVIDSFSTQPSRLFAVDLTTGNRSLIDLQGDSSQLTSLFNPKLDTANNRLYVGNYARQQVVRIDLATGDVQRVGDAFVGSGPVINGGSLLLESATRNPTLLTTALGAVVRVNLATGVRTALTPMTLPGNPAVLFTPKHLQRDTRVGAPAGQVLVADNANNPMTLFTIATGTGARTMLSSATVPYGSPAEFPLDGATGRMFVSYSPSFGRVLILPLDVASGTLGAPLADSMVGTPFGDISAMALDQPAGGLQRLIAADNQGRLWSIDTASGVRTDLSAMGTGPGVVYANAIAVDPASRTALVYADMGFLLSVNLDTGDSALVSGSHSGGPWHRGTGPGFNQLWGRVAADFANRIAYVTTNSNTLLAVDLVSGDRVITAR